MGRRHRLRRVLVAAAMTAPFVMSTGAHASSAGEGQLDTSYAVGGVLADWGAAQAAGGAVIVSAAIVDRSGRLLVAGASAATDGFKVWRYLASGLPDRSFGDNGVGTVTGVTTGSGQLAPRGLTLDASGRILVAGESYDNSHVEVAVGRLTASGLPDTSLCGTGSCIYHLGSTRSDAAGIAVQPSGKFVVGGTIDTTYMFVARYTASGAPDSSFGDGGQKLVNLNQNSIMYAMTMLPDGRILGVGEEWLNGYHGWGLARWTADGQLDTSFNNSGTESTIIGSAVEDSAYAVALLGDGSFVVAGQATWANEDAVVLHYNEDGSPDGSWGTGANLNRSDSYEAYRSISVQRDGKIVLGGDFAVSSSNRDYSIVRITSHGDLDPTFNGSGIQSFDFGNASDNMVATRIDRQGRAIAVGQTGSTTGIVGFVGDATPPSAPSAEALPRYSLGSSSTLQWNAATDDNTGVHTYNVLTRSMRYDATGPGPAGTFKTGLSSRKTTVARKAGYTRCFVVEAQDYAGNVGAPGNEVCTAFPADDRTLAKHGSWSNVKGKAYYLGTLRRSTSAGASLSLKVAFRHLALVATTCPTCGTVKIYLGKKLVLKKSLHAAKTHNRVVIPLASSSGVRSGTLRIVQASGGKQVAIDGLAVSQV